MSSGALTWVAAKALADAAASLRDDGDFGVLSARVPLADWFRGEPRDAVSL